MLGLYLPWAHNLCFSPLAFFKAMFVKWRLLFSWLISHRRQTCHVILTDWLWIMKRWKVFAAHFRQNPISSFIWANWGNLMKMTGIWDLGATTITLKLRSTCTGLHGATSCKTVIFISLPWEPGMSPTKSESRYPVAGRGLKPLPPEHEAEILICTQLNVP
jgi:hypothetical protein